MFVKKRTVVYKNIYQNNTSALKKYIKHGLIQTKIVIVTLKSNIDNI
jgi:hypothetical protein